MAVTVAIATMMKHFESDADSGVSEEQLADVIATSLHHSTEVLRRASAELNLASDVRWWCVIE